MKHLNASNALPSLILLLLLQIILIFQTTITITRADDPNAYLLGLYDCSDDSYTSGSQYESNLISDLLPSLIIDGSRNGFLTKSFGKDQDEVHGLIQCRGDISPQECRSCLNTSRVNITRICPNKKKAVVRLDYCLMRYSDIRFFEKLDMLMSYTNLTWKNENPIPNQDAFDNRLGGLLTNLISNASTNPSRFKSDSTTLSNLSHIYGLVQCTEDLLTADCFTCLTNMFNRIQKCCSGVKGAWISSFSCQLSYRDRMFYRFTSTPPPPLPLLLPQPTTTGKRSLNVAVVIVTIILAALLLLLLALLCVHFVRRKTGTGTTEAAASITGEESLQFDLVTLVNATSNFSDANKLGEGGFGAVYKGELLNGQQVAVKRLTNNSIQGPQQFKNEVTLLHKLQHRNLVRFLGYCLEGEETILIYEYVPNRSLDKYLFDPLKRVNLDWGKRYNIIRGIARGLLYLHEDSRLKIIHRDLKAGNILLDGEMNAKIADFGTAKLFRVDQTTGNTSRAAGTLGYMAPEYALHGLFSVKTDVFSFGVMLLEIVTGQKINSLHESTSPADLLSYAWKHWSEGTSTELIDPALKDNYSSYQAKRSIHVGLLCVQEDSKVRPTMSSIVHMLDNSFALASPARPAFFTLETDSSTFISFRSNP